MKKISLLFLLVIVFQISIFTNSATAQWSLAGNAGTNPGTNFIGTTDAKDFVFKTNNAEKGRVKSNGLWQFGASGNLTKIDSAGNLSFAGTAAYKVAANKYAFQYSGNPNYGLFFNSSGLLYEFRTSTALSVFSIGANSGNGIFKGNLKVGAYTLPATDGTSGQVLKTDGTGTLSWSADNGNAYTAGSGINLTGTTFSINAITDATLIGNGAIATPLKIAQQGASSGQVLKWNGVTWLPSSDNDAQTLSLAGNILSLSNGNNVTLPAGTTYTSGTGIGIVGTVINNTSPDVVVSLTGGSGINITGAYPNFAISSTSGTSQWTTNGSNIYYNTGNVGVGTTSPSAKLHVVSTSANALKIDGGTNMYIGLYEGGTYRGYIGSYYSGNTADVDFGTGVGNTTGGVDLTIQGVPKLTVNADGSLTLGGNVNNSLTVAGTTSYLRMNASNSSGYAWQYSNDGYYNYVQAINAAGSSSIVANFANPTEPYQFTVWGNMQANGFISNSDRKLKTNIQSMDKVFSAIDVVKKLNPVSYDFKTDEYKIMNLPKTKQYGFIAQEMQTVLPNLVQSSNTVVAKDENENLVRDEILSVNYLGVIPVLTEAIKEQQQTIETKTAELEAEKKLNAEQQNQIESLNTKLDEMLNKMNNFETSLSQCCSNSQSTVYSNQLTVDAAKLEQNVPNPFMQNCYIRFYIPSSAKNSSITISDLNGRVMKTFSNLAVGFGAVNINGGELAAGTYQYTLFIDGNKIDSKEMVLTK